MITIALTAIVSLANILLGLFVYRKDPKSISNKLFFIFSWTNALWSVLNYLSLFPPEGTSSIFWLRLHLCISTFHAAVFLTLISVFPNRTVKDWPRKSRIYAAVIGITMLATLTPLVFREIASQGQASVTPGPLIPLFALTAFGSIACGIALVVRRFRASRGMVKEQWRYILIGTSVLFGLIFATVFAPILVIHSSPFVLYMPLYTMAFVVATAYAIVRHRLFDIQAVVARSVAYTFLVTIILALYSIAVFGLSQILHRQNVDGYQVMLYAFLAMFVAGTFQPLKNWLESQTDKVFYRNRYSTNNLMASLSKIMSSTLDPEMLAQKVLDTVSQTMHIQKGAIFLRQQGGYKLLAQSNYPAARSCDEDLLRAGEQAMILAQGEETADRHIRSSMRNKELVLAFPFKRGEDIHGLLLFGEKQSGDLYTNQDIQLLEILGPELAVAIENARSYQQVRDFNQTLQTKVNRATEELRSVNEQLERKNRQLEQLDKLKDEFISVTSHELRTPLTAIRGYLWMVMNNRKDESKKDYLNRAYVSTERLIDLVNDTLDISRMESGRVQLNPQPTKLPDIAKLVVQELASKAEERHQKLIIQHTANIPTALCDPDKIHQVFTNLIGNALKFTPEKGSITVNFYTEKDHVVTAVSDTGPGISPADQKRLFQKFLRLEPTANQPGTGLGLYLCHRVITLSKGKIWVDSQVGQGSTFFFSLPISKDQPSILPFERKAFSGVKI